MSGIAPEALLGDQGDFVPAALFDAARALGLIGKSLEYFALDHSHRIGRGGSVVSHRRYCK